MKKKKKKTNFGNWGKIQMFIYFEKPDNTFSFPY